MFGWAREGFMQGASFHSKLREVRELALQISKKRALQAEKQRMQSHKLRVSERHRADHKAGVDGVRRG